jgi:hypothetical protein
MNDFLSSLKADLLDRRLLPLVALVLVALVGALAYAVLGGGGSSSSSPTAAAVPIPRPSGGLAATQAQTSAKQAVAEMTAGGAVQRHGASRDPFAPLPGAAKAAASATSKTTATSTAGTKTTGGKAGSTPAAATTPTTTPKSAAPAPAKPRTLYKVSLQFGLLPAATTSQSVVLRSWLGLSKDTPLPSASERLIETVGVIVSGSTKSAAFTIDSELIPSSGEAVCLPSKVQCKMIELAPGKNEQLLGTLPNGETATYELRVLTIESVKASTASVTSVLRAQRKAGGELLGQGGLLKLAGLHYSSLAGVLVFDRARAVGARAHTALASGRHGG